MKHFIYLSILLISTTIYSQNRSVAQTNGVFNNNLEFFAMLKVGTKHNNEFSTVVNGKYYLLKKWSDCNIKTTDGKKYSLKSCNYNVYDNRFELLLEKEVLFLKKGIIKEITIDNKVFKPLYLESEFKNNFYEEIVSNEKIKIIKLYKLKKRTIPSTESLGLYQNKVEVKKGLYFIKDNEIIKIPKSTKETFKLLGKTYKKKEHKKLSTKKVTDLVTTINIKN